MKRNHKTDVPSLYVSNGEIVRFSSSIPSHGARYVHRLEGTYCGQEWSCNLTREGLLTLIKMMMEGL